MNIIVIGGSGLVGSNIVSAGSGYDIVETSRSPSSGRKKLDKTNQDVTATLVEEINPDAIVDTAAFHAVDDCETQQQRAFNVNAAGTRNVAVAADNVDAHYVFLSTDYVFPGKPSESPYTENDSLAPLNYYAETKYAGEQAAKIADDYTILRPSVIYGLANDNFVTWALDELEAGNELSIVDDQTSSPTYAPDLASACVEIVEEGLTGLYHATGPESLSRYEFTVELAERYGYDTSLVEPIPTEELGQEAPRPTDSTLDSSRLYDELDTEFRSPARGFEAMQAAEQ